MKFTQALLPFSLLFVSVALPAQVRIRGSVSDSTYSPIAFCAIGLLKSADSSVVKGSLADESGRFMFEQVEPGTYMIKVDYPGYSRTWSDTFSVDSANLELPHILLKSAGYHLAEVGISAIRPPLEFKNGNVTLNVEGTALTAGNSVFDLLRRMPNVMVSNDNISMMGKSGVRIYMDNRQQPFSGLQLINFLKSLSAASIARIELISNPSARYDAAGDAGIIHLHTKRVNATGFSGSVNAGLSQGFYTNEDGGFSLNYKGKKVAVFSSMNGNKSPRHHIETFDRRMSENGGSSELHQRGSDKTANNNLLVNLGADWYVDSLTTLGLKLQASTGNGDSRYNGTTMLSGGNEVYDLLEFQRVQPERWAMLNYNLNADRTLDTNGGKLRFSADYYGPYTDSYQGTYQNRFYDSSRVVLAPQDFKSDNALQIQLMAARLDLEKTIGKAFKLESGVKGSAQRITSDYRLSRPDPATNAYNTDSNYTNTFIYYEKIAAAYLNLEKKFRRFSMQAGLRTEYTDIRTENTDHTQPYQRRYLNLFPVLSLNYEPAKNHQLSLTYNRRINRPEYHLLNPYKSFVSILSSNQGNPYLQPAYTTNLSINYVYKSSLSQSLGYWGARNFIASYLVLNDDTKEMVRTSSNMQRLDQLYYTLYIRKNIRTWWELSFSAFVYYVNYSGSFNGLHYGDSGLPNVEWVNSVFTLPKQVKLELTAYYWSPYLYIGSKYRARGGLNIGFKKSFYDERLSCSVAVNDLFFTETWRSKADLQGQDWQRFESYDTRRVNVSISYNFGKLKIEQRKTAAGEDEQRRMRH